MGDSVRYGENRTLFESPDISTYQPRRTVDRGKRTCTADLCIPEDVQQENNTSAPLKRKDVAQALHHRNVLRVTESIKLSLNRRFCSIKSKMKEIMQTFCTEVLSLAENNTVYFKPDYKPTPKQRSYTFVSFLNVPLKTEEIYMYEFVKQHFEFTKVDYPKQQIDGIEYRTGTRVYWCTKIKHHLPKYVHIFGRWIRVIYTGQPARQKTQNTHNDIRQIEFETDQPDPISDDQSQQITNTPEIDNTQHKLLKTHHQK